MSPKRATKGIFFSLRMRRIWLWISCTAPTLPPGELMDKTMALTPLVSDMALMRRTHCSAPFSQGRPLWELVMAPWMAIQPTASRSLPRAMSPWAPSRPLPAGPRAGARRMSTTAAARDAT